MELCSNIPGIGKMKYLQWLEEYHVKKEDIGFELSELGNLTELGGELKIFNLENVATREEANDAKLISKRNLKALTLVWSAKQLSIGSGVLDGLQPHPNLRALDIRNHGGSTGPTWLCGDVCVKGLKSLHLEGLSWGTFPPFGQLMHLEELTLINIAGIRKFGPDFGGVTQKSFLHLKKIKFVGMPELVEWVGGAHWHLFSKLASIRCEDCPNFSVLLLPFSKCSVICTQDINTVWFPNLCSLEIRNCSKLSLPPMPHNTMLTRVTVKEDNQAKLHFEEETLRIDGYGGALAFHNLDKVKDMTIENMFHISLTDLQKLNSLTSLDVTGCKSMLSSEVDNGFIFCSVQQLNLRDCHLTEKSLGGSFQQLVRLDVDSISAVFVETICSLLAATLIELRFTSDLITESFTEKQEQKGESKMSQGQRHIDPVWSTGHNACSNRMASKVTETAPGALSNGLWLAWAECAQTNQPMCVFGVAQGPARLLGFSSLYSTTHCKQRGARSLLPPRMTPPDE
ncbi:Os02g0262700 [Oryza sativa Japonica Group]|uniref:Os02g0262700 protein n=1 Tax=Oryza sativa subsp. japonica TaxID=39947 RepID=Q0E283_ORYSJ|nr:Os02g0262700 [Oryza sativa Japonica Group]|eukprot:NP_001046491.1 Os02g0262700 [Oryza sativa Japonica Group]